jgi:hypothetical protein
MKEMASLIFPGLLMLLGVYTLITALGSDGEQVALFGANAVPRGLALMFGLIGLVGGGVVIFTSLTNKKRTAYSEAE